MNLRAAACSLILLVALSRGAAAQTTEDQPRIVVGPLAGVSFASLRGSGAIGGGAGDSEGRTGIVAGAFATFTLTPYFAIEPQVLYVQKGGSAFVADSAFIFLSSNIEVDYLEIPLLFKARYPLAEGRWPVILSAVAGPAIGFKLSCTSNDPDGTSQTCGERPILPGYDDVVPENIDFSGVFGIGIDFYHFAFQARYDVSITNSFQFASQLYPYLKNQAWELTLGYKVGVK